MADWIFLDHHSKGRPSVSIAKEMAKETASHWLFGEEGIDRLEKEILSFCGIQGGELRLSSSAAQSHFQILLSHYIDSIRETGRTHILAPETEVKSITGGIKRLEKFEVQGKWIPVNQNGQITKAALEEVVRARSSLLALSWADPLSGVVQPIHDLLEVCREHDIKLHLDVSAALGKLYLPLANLEVDYFTFDGNLLGCPCPVGATLLKKGSKIAPLGFGAPSFPYSYFSSLKKGVSNALEKMDHYAMEVARLRDHLEGLFSNMGGELFFQEVERLPNTVVVAFEGIHAEHLLFHLKRQGLIATTGGGRLCELLTKCGVKRSAALSAIAFTLSDATTQEEIERAAEIVRAGLDSLTPYSERIHA